MNTWFIQGLSSTSMMPPTPCYLPPPCSMPPSALTTGPQLNYRSKSPVQRCCLWSKQTFQLADSPVERGSGLGACRGSPFHLFPQPSYSCQAWFQLSALAASNSAVLEGLRGGERGTGSFKISALRGSLDLGKGAHLLHDLTLSLVCGC